jgi:hypothetical protein
MVATIIQTGQSLNNKWLQMAHRKEIDIVILLPMKRQGLNCKEELAKIILENLEKNT